MIYTLKVLFVIFFSVLNLFFADCLSQQAALNNANIKNDLNTVFNLNPNNQIFVITIARKCHVHPPSSLPLISHDELELVLQILYAICGLNAPAYNNMVGGAPIQLNNDPSTAVPIGNGQRVAVINLAMQLRALNIQNFCNLIVLNEMFFSQRESLTSDQYAFIKNKIQALSVASPNTIVYANFLHLANRNASGRKIYNDYARMIENMNTEKMNISDAQVVRDMIINGCRNDIFTTRAVSNNDTQYTQNYLINETVSISRGSQITSYKKSTYFRESNVDIMNGALYDFGGGKDIPEYTGPNQVITDLMNALLRNISTEICFDLFHHIRLDTRWDNIGIFNSYPSRLHILQSNMINPFDNHNINNLPINVGIVHADPYYAEYPSGLPFCLTDFSSQRYKIELGPDRVLHDIKIGDSIYRICIYQM